MAKKTNQADEKTSDVPQPVRMGDIVLFVGTGGAQPAIATSYQEGSHLSLTAFPPGLPPMAFTGVEEDALGDRKFSWRRFPAPDPAYARHADGSRKYVPQEASKA